MNAQDGCASVRACVCTCARAQVRLWVCPSAEEGGPCVESVYGVGWEALPGTNGFQRWTPPGRAADTSPVVYEMAEAECLGGGRVLTPAPFTPNVEGGCWGGY